MSKVYGFLLFVIGIGGLAYIFFNGITIITADLTFYIAAGFGVMAFMGFIMMAMTVKNFAKMHKW